VEDALTGLVNVMEIWDDDAALKAHFKTPWIIEFFGNYGPQMVATTVQVYDIAGTPRPLPPM
jgi:quinol monooxygenase YgiN